MISFSKDEAIVSLYSKGIKIQAKGWDASSYVELKGGAVVDQDGNAFDMTKAKATKWHEWSEPVEKSVSSSVLLEKVGKLEKMLEQALNRKDEVVEVSPAKAEPTKSSAEDAHEKIMAVYGVDSAEKVRKLFKDALVDAKSSRDVQIAVVHAIPYCWIGRSLNTTRQYYSEMRKIVKEVGGDFEDIALTLLLPPSREITKMIDGIEQTITVGLYESLNEISEAKVVEKMGGDGQELYDLDQARKVIFKLYDMIENNDFEQKKQTSAERAKAYVYASYLAMVTGRRQIEILYTLSMTKEKNEWYYEGLAKKDGDSKIKAYALDDDFSKLNEMLKYVQGHISSEMKGKEMTAKTVASKFNGSFNNAIKNLTGLHYKFSDWREISVDMMAIEACESGEFDCSNPVEVEKFKAKVLGHSVPKGSLRATLHYMTKKGVSHDK